jgi:hypothetical protein
MRAASRAVGSRARRSTGRATGDRAAMRPTRAVSPPLVVRDVPSDRRGPAGSAWSTSVRLADADPSSVPRPRSRDPRAVSGSAGSGEIRSLTRGSLVARVSALRRSPCISERASSEVPGCGHASCRSARGSVPASAANSPGRPIRCQPSGSRAMPRSEDQLAARRPSARDGAVPAGHLPPIQRRESRRRRVVVERGETGVSGGATLLGDCPRSMTCRSPPPDPSFLVRAVKS